MSNTLFTDEQVAALRSNPNVRKATPKSIQFSERFKLDFIEQYDQGKLPIQVFRDAGFDVEAIGRKRLERAYTNWLHKRSLGKSVTSDKRGRAIERELSDKEIIERQRAEIEMLRQENDFLRQIRRLERRHQPSKSPSTKDSR
jgi:cell division protein FtsI/penicillin-binding protein 2